MHAYAINYTLRRPGQRYARLFDAIMSYDGYYHAMDPFWIVKSAKTAAQIRDHLVRCIDRNDQLMVSRMTGEAAWIGLTANGCSWMHGEMKQAA